MKRARGFRWLGIIDNQNIKYRHSWESRIEENHAMNLASFCSNLGTLVIAHFQNFSFRESSKCKGSYHYSVDFIKIGPQSKSDHVPFKILYSIEILYMSYHVFIGMQKL